MIGEELTGEELTGEELTRDQTLDRTSQKLIRLVKDWKFNESHISNAIQYILDIVNLKWGLTEEELTKEIDSFIDKIECRK